MEETAELIDGLFVRSRGEGEPTLLFVHGYCCSGSDWTGQLAALSSRYRCVALDLPGHGDSRVSASPTMPALGAAVNRVKRSLSGPVVLIGHSLGCKTIREAYRQCEAQVAGLVFIDGSVYIGRRDAVRRAAHNAVEKDGMATFLERLVDGMFSPSTDPAAIERVRTRARRMDASFARDLFFDSVEWDVVEAVQTLREIAVPTMVVQCTAFDTSFGWRAMREDEETPFMNLVRILTPAPQIKVICTSGHFPMLDAPDVLNETLDEFVAGLG